jgi:uncharacterized membrane-anchored protein
LIPLPGLYAASLEETRKVELQDLTARLKYQEGRIDLSGGLATLNLNQGFRYLDPAGAETVLIGIWGNPPSNSKTLGMIVPAGFSPVDSNAWCVVMHYEESGYIKDNDAEKIDYSKLLKEMKAAVRQASTERVKNGYPPLELVGWATPPRYDKQTHKLYWAKELRFGGEQGDNTLNYNLRILGRRGVLVLNTVAGMAQLPKIEQATPEILGMVDFNPGHRYADYTPGTDKVAAYGLAALVAGGIAAKAGLFKGLFLGLLALKKFLILFVIGLVAIVKKFFSGKKSAA